MKTSLRKTIEGLNPGDLVCCSWCDASVGKSSGSGTAIDVPVKSWGIYVGLIGDKVKHIVLAQNSFRYSDGLFDLDYTAVPLSWTVDVSVLIKEHVPKELAGKLVNSFMMGGHRSLNRPRTFQRRIFQQRLSIDGRPY
ncbi:MAG: hypothetical protein QM398_02855 [Thermoproteota archaeon]|nr:hypothetical protein [Thermoproteota archaeon]NLD66149.1 hypothetical protein [Thermoproteota archaeon]